MTEVIPFRIKVQILCGGEPAFGPGKAMVLESIRRWGSISAAGRHLNMSYRRTWNLVDMMNRCWNEPLVVAARGGGKEAGARLTARGQAVLVAYRSLEARLDRAAHDGDHATLLAGLRAVPKPALGAGESSNGDVEEV